MSHSLDSLNALTQDAFIQIVGPLFEHSPWIAERAWATRPFKSAEELHAAMVEVVQTATPEAQINLVRAHPDLAGKLAIAGRLTEHSTAEQKSARLDRLSPDQFARISALNERYRTRFDFPFVICVKDHTQDSILAAFEQRVTHSPAEELPAALHQIGRIAWHRLHSLLGTS